MTADAPEPTRRRRKAPTPDRPAPDVAGVEGVLSGLARWHAQLGRAVEVMRTMPDACFDAIVTDAPYGLRELPLELVLQAIDAWRAGEVFSPSGGGFLGHEWDAFVPGPEVWRECLRVLKPGGYMLVFAGSRTQDLMGLSIRLAGFEIRDTFAWLYGTGLPKSANLSKAIDRARHGGRADVARVTAWIRARLREVKARVSDLDAACGTKGMGTHWTTQGSQPLIPTLEQWRKLEAVLGAAPEWMVPLLLPANAPGPAFAQREVVARRTDGSTNYERAAGGPDLAAEFNVTRGATEEARAFEGSGTAMRPANEPIIVARKPLIGTLAENLLTHGTGALQVDACRVGATNTQEVTDGDLGRFPPNVLLCHLEACKHVGDIQVPTVENGDDGAFRLATDSTELLEEWECADGCPVGILAAQSGVLSTGAMPAGTMRRGGKGNALGTFKGLKGLAVVNGHGASTGTAARFYPQFAADGPEGAVPFLYTPKPNKRERHAGCYQLGGNRHPTVKPIALMRWLVRLVGRKGAKVLDPFMGSGTTLLGAGIEGMSCVGIDDDPQAVDVARARAAHWLGAASGEALAPTSPGAPRAQLALGPLFDAPARGGA